MAEITPSDAIEVVRRYMEGLKLPYQVSCGEPETDLPGFYYVPVTLRRRDGIALQLEISVDLEGRYPQHDERPTREQLIAAVNGLDHYNVTFRVANQEIARQIAYEVFRKRGVLEYEAHPVLLGTTDFDSRWEELGNPSFEDASTKKRYRSQRTKRGERIRRKIIKGIGEDDFDLQIPEENP